MCERRESKMCGYVVVVVLVVLPAAEPSVLQLNFVSTQPRSSPLLSALDVEKGGSLFPVPFSAAHTHTGHPPPQPPDVGQISSN